MEEGTKEEDPHKFGIAWCDIMNEITHFVPTHITIKPHIMNVAGNIRRNHKCRIVSLSTTRNVD